ncbi:MAG: hypothetical protein IJW21_00500 [Clostridia bacterium]|nr:hypothetical protein [Clostridia bacterium]
MGTFTVIFLSFSAVLLIYLLFRRLFAMFAESELRKSRCARISRDSVEIYARGESLEYCLRLALTLNRRTVVFVKKDGSDAELSGYIAEAMQRYYDFEIRYI